MGKKKTKVLIFMAIIIAAAAAASFFLREEEAIPVQSALIEREVVESRYTQIIDLSGYIEPYDTQTSRFRSTGAVTGVYVEEGDHVVKGQLLASIDNTSQLAALQSIRDQIEEAELRGSERELQLLRLQETNALNALDYTNIYALFDGEIAELEVAESDYFEAGDEVLTLVDRSRLKATVEIDEIDMQHVYEGQKAMLSFDALPGVLLEAEVSYIPMLGRYSDQGIGVVDVEILIEDPPEGLMPGFTFEGTIEAESESSMLLIPQAAVTTERGGATTVEKKTESGTERVSVRVEYLGEGYCRVLSGDIEAGDILVYQAASSAEPGMPMMPGGPR